MATSGRALPQREEDVGHAQHEGDTAAVGAEGTHAELVSRRAAKKTMVYYQNVDKMRGR